VVPNVIDYIELSRGFSIVDLPAQAPLVGHSLKDLQLRNRFGLMLIAIKRRTAAGSTEVTHIAPGADYVIQAGDVLSMLGANERLAEMDRVIGAGG